jgi:hypothetical protein
MDLKIFRSDSAVGKGYSDAPFADASYLWNPISMRGRLMLFLAKIPVIRKVLADKKEVTFGARKQTNNYLSAYRKLNFGDEALSSFGPELKFTQFSPKVEHEKSDGYFLGKKA